VTFRFHFEIESHYSRPIKRPSIHRYDRISLLINIIALFIIYLHKKFDHSDDDKVSFDDFGSDFSISFWK
jgi:hypothetical protein